MKTIPYTNNQGLELKINKFASGAFSLTFNNGAHTFCDTMTELRTILLKNGMTWKWAANVKDRFDPLTRKEKFLAFIGFKAGLMGERLAEIQTKPASPDPIEMVIMGILKNGKKC